jgi:biopolymer transport protein ExbD
MKFYTKPRRKPAIIVVTMIDVFSVLLIFFIVATTFRKNMLPAVKISLPEAKSGVPTSQTEPIILTITADEKVFINSKEISLTKLKETFAQLGKQSPQPAIAMQADKKASFGMIIKIMDAAKEAGFAQLPAFIDDDQSDTK